MKEMEIKPILQGAESLPQKEEEFEMEVHPRLLSVVPLNLEEMDI